MEIVFLVCERPQHENMFCHHNLTALKVRNGWQADATKTIISHKGIIYFSTEISVLTRCGKNGTTVSEPQNQNLLNLSIWSII